MADPRRRTSTSRSSRAGCSGSSSRGSTFPTRRRPTRPTPCFLRSRVRRCARRSSPVNSTVPSDLTSICRATGRQCSSMSEDLFEPIFVPDLVRDAVRGRAWLQAMLDAEAALAVAQARAGLIPAEAAKSICECCTADRFDPEEIGRKGRAAGNPVVPLVKALTAAVSGEASGEAARYVHKGATSQDIMDTAAMLVARSALDLILADFDKVAAACAHLADAHRTTIMAGRTLLQQALPMTFGLKAAGWLVAVLEARRRLLTMRGSGLAAQLGGAAGTLAPVGADGLRGLTEFSRELGL